MDENDLEIKIKIGKEDDKLEEIKIRLTEEDGRGERLTKYTENSNINMLNQNISFSSNNNNSKDENNLVVVFTVLFKVVSVIFYLLFNVFLKDDILLFIIVILLTALDFYTVKNISGRLLIGMRWWTEIDLSTGLENWHFESHENTFQPVPAHSNLFWSSQLFITIFWLLIAFLNLISLKLYWVIHIFQYSLFFILYSLLYSNSFIISYYPLGHVDWISFHFKCY